MRNGSNQSGQGGAATGTAPAVTEMRQRAEEYARNLGAEHYRRAYESGQSLSVFLEREMPSGDYNDGLDAFSRLLMVNEIHSRSLPEYGVHADRFERFFENAHTRALLPEWTRRQWMRAALGRDISTRGLYTSNDSAVGTAENPWRDNPAARVDKQIAPVIPLAELIAVTTPIDGDAYRTFYLKDDPTQQRMVRVGESAEIPRAKLTQSENTIRLFKFGRALETTYEVLRRMRIDRVALLIARMAVQAELDKVAAILDVLVNGDGNAGTSPTSYNLTTLDPAASAGTLTLKGWLAFKLKFANPYMLTTALVQEAVALQMFLLNTGSANLPTAVIPTPVVKNITAFDVINPGLGDGTRLGWTADAPTLKIVGFDRRFAVERAYEIGSNIQEIERVILNQTQIMTMTEVEGYGIIDPNATKLLNVNA